MFKNVTLFDDFSENSKLEEDIKINCENPQPEELTSEPRHFTSTSTNERTTRSKHLLFNTEISDPGMHNTPIIELTVPDIDVEMIPETPTSLIGIPGTSSGMYNDSEVRPETRTVLRFSDTSCATKRTYDESEDRPPAQIKVRRSSDTSLVCKLQIRTSS